MNNTRAFVVSQLGNVSRNSCIPIASLQPSGNSWQSSYWMKMLFVAFTTVTVIVGITGNTVVIAAIMRYRRLQSARNIFILNLSFSDLLVLILALPIVVYYFVVKEWIFGSFLCRAVPSVESISVSITSLTLAVIAIDVFILTIFPSWPQLKAFKAWITVIFIWVLAITGAIPRVLSHGLYDFNGRICETICYDYLWKSGERLQYEIIMIIVQFAIPISIVVFCYGKVVWRLKQLEKTRRVSSAGCSSLMRRRRGTRLLICMMLAFLLFNSMDIIIKMLKISQTMPRAMMDSEDFITTLSHLLCITTAIWNPILYAFLNKSLREVFSQMFRCQKGAANSSSVMQLPLKQRSSFANPRSACPTDIITAQLNNIELENNQTRRLTNTVNGSTKLLTPLSKTTESRKRCVSNVDVDDFFP